MEEHCFGTGGLVRSYGGTAKLALKEITKVKMQLCVEYKITIEYDNYNSMQYYCKNNNIKILNVKFMDKVEINVLVLYSYTQTFLHDLSEFTNRNCYFEEVSKYYHE